MEVNKKKSDKEKFGEWFFKRQSKEVKKLIDKIDLDIKDIKMENNNQEPTRECCGKCYGKHNPMTNCHCHSIKPPVEEKCKCDCFYSGRASMVEIIEGMMKNYKHMCESQEGKECEYIKALDDILQALKNKENE